MTSFFLMFFFQIRNELLLLLFFLIERQSFNKAVRDHYFSLILKADYYCYLVLDACFVKNRSGISSCASIKSDNKAKKNKKKLEISYSYSSSLTGKQRKRIFIIISTESIFFLILSSFCFLSTRSQFSKSSSELTRNIFVFSNNRINFIYISFLLTKQISTQRIKKFLELFVFVLKFAVFFFFFVLYCGFSWR